jgi:outer membrane protein assembly factor BamA
MNGLGFESDYPLNEELRARVLYALQARGYFRAQVEKAQVRGLKSGKMKEVAAIVPVEAHAQYHLKAIEFTKGSVFNQQEMRHRFALSDGEIFDTDRVAKGMEALRGDYAEKGFLNLVAIPQVQIDESGRLITLRMDLGVRLPIPGQLFPYFWPRACRVRETHGGVRVEGR